MSDVSSYGQHPDDVLEWRRSEFERMGFASYVAEYLAMTRIDLHMMEDLLNNNCPPHFATQILAGTSWHGDDF